ncbi:MAG: hypothetical protein R2873_30585 [Caldilineaceae bacterium]|nr:hypothetical protein [Caldilineaceae bacterium]
MNLWYPIGLLVSLFVVYGSIKDDQLLRADGDAFLRRVVRGDGWGFYITLQAAIGRATRNAASELADIQDRDQRMQKLESVVVRIPNKARLLKMTLWEIRFRLVAFLVFAFILAYDFFA